MFMGGKLNGGRNGKIKIYPPYLFSLNLFQNIEVTYIKELKKKKVDSKRKLRVSEKKVCYFFTNNERKNIFIVSKYSLRGPRRQATVQTMRNGKMTQFHMYDKFYLYLVSAGCRSKKQLLTSQKVQINLPRVFKSNILATIIK